MQDILFGMDCAVLSFILSQDDKSVFLFDPKIVPMICMDHYP